MSSSDDTYFSQIQNWAVEAEKLVDFVNTCLLLKDHVIIGDVTIFVCWLLRVCKMISPQGMDELFWGRDHEDVND
jgi:hypothetical protein